MRYFTLLLLAAMNTLAVLAETRAAEPVGLKALAIGDAAPDFKLPGVDGKEYTLKSFADARLLLMVFTCNHCPRPRPTRPALPSSTPTTETREWRARRHLAERSASRPPG
jgi:hypothetical protein